MPPNNVIRKIRETIGITTQAKGQSPEFEVFAGASNPQTPQIRELPHDG
jgi:hypothetical protein